MPTFYKIYHAVGGRCGLVCVASACQSGELWFKSCNGIFWKTEIFLTKAFENCKIVCSPMAERQLRKSKPSQSGSKTSQSGWKNSNGSVIEGGRLGIEQAGLKWKWMFDI